MNNFIKELKKYVTIGVVGGSDLVKQQEQLGKDGINKLYFIVINNYDYSFSENGLVAYHNGELIHSFSLKKMYTEEQLKEFINYSLHSLADIDIPIKRGTFIEFRTGMINISPIGRNCTQEERDAFVVYNNEHHIIEKLRENLLKKFGEKMNLTISIGGQISIDCFPNGWNKTYCLQHVENEGYNEIHFFGDKTMKGGNDYEIFNDKRVIGHTVTSWENTMKQCKEIFMK